MAKKEEKKWYQSKTKWAAVLVGLGPVLATLAGMISGDLGINGLVQLSTELGVILAVFGIRDLPFINKQ